MKRFLLLLLPLSAFAQDDCEPNNTFDSAPLTLTESKSWFGADKTIHTADDLDIWRIKATANGDLTFSVRYIHHRFQQPNHVSLEVLNADGEVIATPEGPVLNDLINFRTVTIPVVQSKTYYVRYQGIGGAIPSYTAGAYYELEPDSHEPNDESSSPTDLGIIPVNDSVVINGSIHDLDDRDFFRFVPKKNGMAKVVLRAGPNQGNLSLRILDSDGNEITSASTTGLEESLTIPVQAEQSYLCEIFPAPGQLHDGYQLTVSTPPDPDRFEDNETLQTATELADLVPNIPVEVENLSLHNENDRDFFVFSKDIKGALFITVTLEETVTNSSNRPSFSLYQGDGSLFSTRDIAEGSNTRTLIAFFRPSGAHYLEVVGNGTFTNYSIKIEPYIDGSYEEFARRAVGDPNAEFASPLALYWAMGASNRPEGLPVPGPKALPDGRVELSFPGRSRAPVALQYSLDGEHWLNMPAETISGSTDTGQTDTVFGDLRLLDTPPESLDKAFFRIWIENPNKGETEV